MRYRLHILMLAISIIAMVITGMAGGGYWYTAGEGVFALAVLVLLSRSVFKPLNAVRNGVYLLREQDFGSRLRLTGQSDADRVVDLFNRLMDSMKSERLKLVEQEKFLSQIVEVSPMGIAVCDYDGNIVESNRAWKGMQSPELDKAVAAVPEGESRTVRVASSQIVKVSRLWFMDSGFRRQFILAERLTDEIVDAEKQMFSRIVRTIGHEVNNSLGSVISVLDSIGDDLKGDRAAAEAVNVSMSSCHNLVKFVKGYADVVKLPAPEMECVRVGEWLRREEAVLTALAPHNIRIVTKIADETDEVLADPVLMERVLVNVVRNAVESIGDKPDGLVRIVACGCGEVRVTDNGAGIDPAVADRLFTPFFSTKRPDRGLGMMLIADILRSHGARFALENRSEGGAVFYFVMRKTPFPNLC